MLNPLAVIFWTVFTIIGWLFSHTIDGALIGLAISTTISAVAGLRQEVYHNFSIMCVAAVFTINGWLFSHTIDGALIGFLVGLVAGFVIAVAHALIRR